MPTSAKPISAIKTPLHAAPSMAASESVTAPASAVVAGTPESLELAEVEPDAESEAEGEADKSDDPAADDEDAASVGVMPINAVGDGAKVAVGGC